MTDIHTHVLPLVDDGSPSVEVSLELLKSQVLSGVQAVVLTPHYSIERGFTVSGKALTAAFNSFKSAAQSAGINIKLYLGQEICYSPTFDIVELLKKGELLSINGSKYVLIEFLFDERPESVSDVIYSLKIAGYKVVVAHVERYQWITLNTVKSMRANGALVQVNADSLFGKNGFKAKHFAKKIIKEGLVNLVASDEHSFRPSLLKKARALLKNDEYFIPPEDMFLN